MNGSFTMNGGKSGTNSFSLNGAPISLNGSFQLAPNVDAIQEFKVMTNTFDASMGRTGGGSVNTTLKSGYARLRQMDNITVNLAAAKTFNMTEKWKFQVRGEAFNLMNRPIYKPASTTYTDARFGMLSIEQQNFPRMIQVSGKIMF